MLRRLTLAALAVAAISLFSPARAQTGYGVSSNGTLFRFDVQVTGSVTTIGNLGIVPEAIDFRPGTTQLYAIDVGATTTQLYRVNTSTAAITPVGGGFPSEVTGQPSGNYSLLGATIGFDFNPRTLQADGSVRIRVVASNGTNLRLNSDTGNIAAIDTPLFYPAPDPNGAAKPMVDAAAYINSAFSTPAVAGTTTLYVMDFGTDDLATQNPPNAGQLNTVGPFGVTVDANSGIGFDIVTDPASVDDGIGGDRAYAVLRRLDGPPSTHDEYLLYDVNLATGQLTGGRQVGDGTTNFAGGFAALQTAAGTILISEFRPRGPNGPLDEFIEVYNNSETPHTVTSVDGSAGYAVAAEDGTVRCTIPNGTVIPARGHYLCGNGISYSLRTYAELDFHYPQDTGDSQGVALFSTANPAAFSLANRLDAFGYPSSPALYREGTGFPFTLANNVEQSFYRDMSGRTHPEDTGDNAADFIAVNAQPDLFDYGLVLGAPGPENLKSPIQRNAQIPDTLFDPAQAEGVVPNRERNLTPVPNGSLGTLTFRRTMTNNTGSPLTRLRIRVVDITTFNTPPAGGGGPGLAPPCHTAACTDLRALSSPDEAAVATSSGPKPTSGLDLEVPPQQPLGGGYNASLDVRSVKLATPLAPGASVNINIRLGVNRNGSFRFFINVEALP